MSSTHTLGPLFEFSYRVLIFAGVTVFLGRYGREEVGSYLPHWGQQTAIDSSTEKGWHEG